MEIVVLIGLCLIVYIAVMVSGIKLIYQQIGSTCGFYALVYGISKVEKINKKRVVKRIIRDCISNGESFVGEIFDIALMEKIVSKYFPDVKAKVVNISGIQDIDKILEENYIVYPCLQGITPHYCFLEGKEKTKYIYRQTLFRKCKIDKEKCYQWHQDLKNVTEYEWKYFYDKKLYGIEKVLLPFGHGCMFLSDSELFLLLEKNKKEKKDMLYDRKTKVNMLGKSLIIPRNKIPVK